MARWVHYLPVAAILLFLLWMHVRMGRWLLAGPWFACSPRRRWIVWGACVLLAAWLSVGAFAGAFRTFRLVAGAPWFAWVRAGALWWALLSIGIFSAALVWRRIPKFDPNRRHLLRLAGGALVAAPFAATAFGVLVERLKIRIREVDIPVPDLPKDLEGLRLVQLSDIHLGPFLDEKELAQAVDMANELGGHVALVTGDLITSGGDPLDACLRQLARLRADGGVYGCLGNHEGYTRVEEYTTRNGARLGVHFLREEAKLLRFGKASLNLAGVDYQSYFRPYLEKSSALLAPEAVNILLSHNPGVFPVAARQGWDLTLSGHTHGGQLNFEILNQSLNVARFYTPYVYGVYREGSSSVYVTRGIGTVGIPARIGAPPEIALIRLSRRHGGTASARTGGPPRACAT